MREIKFRAWSKRNGYFIKQEMLSEPGFNKSDTRFINDIFKDDGYVFMQYTGLKDENGREIYEGDVLRYPAKDSWEEKSFVGYEVFYHDNDCADRHVGFQMNRMHFYGNLCGGECKAWFLPKYTSQMEVIGNIYENPELLEVTE